MLPSLVPVPTAAMGRRGSKYQQLRASLAGAIGRYERRLWPYYYRSKDATNGAPGLTTSNKVRYERSDGVVPPRPALLAGPGRTEEALNSLLFCDDLAKSQVVAALRHRRSTKLFRSRSGSGNTQLS